MIEGLGSDVTPEQFAEWMGSSPYDQRLHVAHEVLHALRASVDLEPLTSPPVRRNCRACGAWWSEPEVTVCPVCGTDNVDG